MSAWRDLGLVISSLTVVVPMAPSAPPQPHVEPVVAQVQALYSNVEDLAKAAEVSETTGELNVILNSNVLFAKDSAVILPSARARLKEIGEQLRTAGPGSVQVVGYTDDLGTAEHGLVLSRQRATAVAAILKPYLGGKTVTVTGRGEANPRVPNTDEASRAQNRRVEVYFKAS